MANQEITKAQIEKLSDEAGEAGDLEQVAICDKALEGDAAAVAECARVIADAAGRADDSREEEAHGYTFAAWLDAANRADGASQYDLRAAWRAGENPEEYTV